MRSSEPSTKHPHPDNYYAPHSSVPPPSTAGYQDSAAPYSSNPSTLPPSTGRGFSIADTYTSSGPRGLPEMGHFNQDPNRGLGIAPGTRSGPVLPANSQTLPPSNPSHPSLINTRPHQTAASGIPLSHQQPLPPTMDYDNHHPSTSYYHDPPPGALVYNYPPNGQQVAVRNFRHRARVEVACDSCRIRKHKCDGERPSCWKCKDLGLKCIYRDAQLPKQDRTLYEIAKKVDALAERFTSIPQRLDDIERQLRALQTSSKLQNIVARAPSAHKALPSSQTTLNTYHAAAAHTILEWPVMEPFFRGIIPSGINYPQELEGPEELGKPQELETPQELGDERGTLKSGCGLNSETLDLDCETVNDLHQSYLKGIHPSQPLLDTQHLASRIEEFVKRYSPGAVSRSSCISLTIDNAIVLLVLALGRICEYKTHLLGPLSLNDATLGLDYYTFASSILHTVHGRNNLPYGQAGVLACLYKDQLLCVSGSWSWIQNVCRICGALIDKNKESLNPNALRLGVSDKIAAQEAALGVAKGVDSCGVNLKSFFDKNLGEKADFRFSNIRAEMSHLRPNNISENAGRIGLPSRMEPSEEIDLMCFSAQIYLEKILKEAQAALYGKRQKQSAVYNDILEDQLRTWRETLPECLRWDDSDEPSNNVNKARMRAKYYGAIQIITRPTLLHAIHANPAPDFLTKGYGFTRADENNSPDPSESLESLSKEDWHRVMMASKRCVNSAVQSIIAFDGIDANERLIVTNVFGTTHAQFGNCLVLAAVRKSWMRDLVPHGRAIGLIERTVRFLRRLEPVSPTLRVDTMILEKTLKALHGK